MAAPAAGRDAEVALETRLRVLEQRLKRLELGPVSPGTIASNFVARADEAHFIAAPAAGIAGTLPPPSKFARGSRLHLVFLNANPVLLACVGGTVNGQAAVTHDVPGAYTAVCDGEIGWWYESLELGAHLAGTGLHANADGTLSPRQRPRHALIYDYFVSGNTTTGQIGALGWNLLGIGTPTVVRNNATIMGSSGRVEITTSTAINDRAVLCLGETETRDILPARDMTLLQTVCSQDGTLTTKRFFFGLMGTFAVEPSAAVECLGIYYDSAVSPNYQVITRSASVGAPVNTGVAVPSATAELLTIYQSVTGTYEFYNGNTKIGTISAGVTTNAMNVGFRVETLVAAAARHVNVGYFGLEAVAGNAFDDDEFLQG